MVRRAGIHRIAAVVARRANVDGAGTNTPSMHAQLDLFHGEAASEGPSEESVDAADPRRTPVLSPSGAHGTIGPAPLAGEPSPSASSSPTDALELDGERASLVSSHVVHVAACPMCTWWVSRASTRCECCGVGLLDGALAPQAELSFLDAPTASLVDHEPLDREGGSLAPP